MAIIVPKSFFPAALVWLLLGSANAAPLEDRRTDFEQGAEQALVTIEHGLQVAVFWLMRPFAELGHSGSQFKLAEMYAEGYGVQQDHTEAANWYGKAAEQGHVFSQLIAIFFHFHI